MPIDREARRPVVLFGPMGSGKSSVGARVAALMARPFIDLDPAVEQAAGKSVNAIFAQDGESRFRVLERAALDEALAREDAPVIAAGGGALCDLEIRDRVHDLATVIVLTADTSALAARIAGGANRPLLATGDVSLTARLDEILSARRDAYRDSAIVIDTTSLALDDVAARAAAAVADTHIAVSRANPKSWIHFTTDPWRVLSALVDAARPTSVAVVTDDIVAELHVPGAVAALGERLRGSPIVFPHGEASKQLSCVEAVLEGLAARSADRGSMVVAIGGGVVTDLGGFAASIYMRGVRWIAIPTTTLGMLDAAIGGKTGVDVGAVKNLAGAFHLPDATILCTALAATESERAIRSGLAEAMKTLAVGDAEAFAELEAFDAEALTTASGRDRWILASARIKARIVSGDPRDLGSRAALNFGHTFGHAFESIGGFARWTHGEAIALGMVAALRVGVRLGLTPSDVASRIERLLARAGLPTRIEGEWIDEACGLIARDKKRLGDEVRMVFLTGLGEPVSRGVPLVDLPILSACLAD